MVRIELGGHFYSVLWLYDTGASSREKESGNDCSVRLLLCMELVRDSLNCVFLDYVEM